MLVDLDLVTGLLGRPDSIHVAGVEPPVAGGSAAVVSLCYPHAISRCRGSSLMPQPYGVRGGYRATFDDAVIEYAMHAGFTGQGPSTPAVHTGAGDEPVGLADTSP